MQPQHRGIPNRRARLRRGRSFHDVPDFRRPRRARPPHRCSRRPGQERALPDSGRHPARHPRRPRRARSREDRLGQDPRLLAAARRAPRGEDRPPSGSQAPRARARPHPRAREPDRRGHQAPRRGVPADHDDRLRRRQPEASGRRSRRGCRHPRRVPRAPRGPDRSGLREPGRCRDHGARRGRPHGRPRLPSRCHAPAVAHARRRSAPAVLGDAGQRRRQAGEALSAQRGAALGRRGALARRRDDAPRVRARRRRCQEGPRADARLGHRAPHPVHAHQAPGQEAGEAADRRRHSVGRSARQPVAAAARPQPRRLRRRPRQGARRDRRGRPRCARRRRRAGRARRPARRAQGLPAPLGPYRPRRHRR